MRTRIILISGLALLATGIVLVVTSDAGSPGAEAGKSVVAGFYPLAFAAEQVGGPSVEVQNLTPPGVEPHDLEVSAGDIQDLQSADVVLLMGRGFQPQLEQAAGRGGAQVAELLETPGLDVLGEDPHVWLDPLRYVLIVRRVADELGQPAAAGPFVRRLHTLDRTYRQGLANCARHEIVTSHDAFGYLVDRYGLEQIAVTGLAPEAEPSPADLAGTVERVRESGATTVFGETLLSQRLTDTVARETGASTAVLDPIEGLTDAERDRGEDYFSLMRRNLRQIRAGLGCM